MLHINNFAYKHEDDIAISLWAYLKISSLRKRVYNNKIIIFLFFDPMINVQLKFMLILFWNFANSEDLVIWWWNFILWVKIDI